MADYIEPTQTEFENNEQVALDVMGSYAPEVMTKTGSVVRELLLRPFSYLMAWFRGNSTNDMKQYSVAYLKTSQLTDNPIADMVASNYFVTRNGGTNARGIITMTRSTSRLHIAQGSRFSVGGISMITPNQYMITPSDPPSIMTGNTVYLKSIPYGSNWIVNVPVVAATAGKVELPIGTDVVVGFGCSVLVDAELTSPVTGGSDVETDAQLMQRAEANTATAGIGTYYGLVKKFAAAPVNVKGLAAVAGDDQSLFRSRYNNMNINPGGYVDCHVKTAVQPTTELVSFECSLIQDTHTYMGKLPTNATATRIAGFYRVDSLIVNGESISEFSVSYGHNDNSIVNDAGARLSVDQTATITFDLTSLTYPTTLTATMSVTYMPGIYELQQYIDGDREHFIGQDIKVKAAVPVTVGMDCVALASRPLTDQEEAYMKQVIVDYINGIEVGTAELNFSNIRKVAAEAVPFVDLQLPCTFTASMYLKDGSMDTFYSNTGILDISNTANQGYWSYQMCFFSCCVDNIRLAVI